MRILVVEDQAELAAAISDNLRRQGMTVDVVSRVDEAEAAWSIATYAAIVLDINLPDGSGVSLLRSARRAGRQTPVLILTAMDSVSDRISGLDAGADDYLTKPFDGGELSARLRALVRRAALPIVREIQIGSMTVDLEARLVRGQDGPVALSRSEFLALECLARHQDRVCSRDTLANAIYTFDEEWSDGAIELHIHRLRKKLAAHSGAAMIKVLRGLGYMLVVDAGREVSGGR